MGYASGPARCQRSFREFVIRPALPASTRADRRPRRLLLRSRSSTHPTWTQRLRLCRRCRIKRPADTGQRSTRDWRKGRHSLLRPTEATVMTDKWRELSGTMLKAHPRLLAISVDNKLNAAGFDGSHPTALRAVRNTCGPRFKAANAVWVPIDTEPGEEAQFDFCASCTFSLWSRFSSARLDSDGASGLASRSCRSRSAFTQFHRVPCAIDRDLATSAIGRDDFASARASRRSILPQRGFPQNRVSSESGPLQVGAAGLSLKRCEHLV